MKANATIPARRNTVRSKTNTKNQTTGKVRTKKNTGFPLSQASADLPEQQIALDSIVPNDFNPRRNFSEQSLRELADNMTRVGLIHAVTLRPRSDGQEGYSLVCGERRFRAARLAGWETIRAKILPDERRLKRKTSPLPKTCSGKTSRRSSKDRRSNA